MRLTHFAPFSLSDYGLSPDHGFLPEDPLALAAAIGRFLDEPELLVPMGQAARARYDAFPTWDDGAVAIRRFAGTLIASRDSEPRHAS